MKQDTALNKRVTRVTGTVISDKMEKTVVVSVSRKTRHPLYRKIVLHTKKYKAHNIIGAKVGDKVQIQETKPLSRDKRFMVTKIFEKATQDIPVFEEPSDLEILLGHEEKAEETEESNKEKSEGEKS